MAPPSPSSLPTSLSSLLVLLLTLLSSLLDRLEPLDLHHRHGCGTDEELDEHSKGVVSGRREELDGGDDGERVDDEGGLE